MGGGASGGRRRTAAARGAGRPGGRGCEYEFRGTVAQFGLLRAVDALHRMRADFEVLSSRIGRRHDDPAEAVLVVRARSEDGRRAAEEAVVAAGGKPVIPSEARLERAPRDAALPAGFYSTTNHPTEVRVGKRWVAVAKQKMDASVVVSADGTAAECRVMGEVKRGERVVVGEAGVRVHPPARSERAKAHFEFMASAVSSEKPVGSILAQVAREIRRAKKAGEKVCVVAGPAVVHTGASDALAALIREGYVDVLFAGNALAAHDLERQLYGTSLGAGLDGVLHEGGHRNHLYAINEARTAGSIRALVEAGRVRAGIMYEALRRRIPVVLAGSIRDDGPLPEVVTDVMESQRRMRAALDGVGVVLMLATLLHSVAVGNLLGSHVRTACVDINPATVTKLSDRGTSHALGIVTDVGVFLPQLARALGIRAV